MKDFVQVDGFQNNLTNEVFISMKDNYKNRVKTDKHLQRQIDFFHVFKNEPVNSEVTLNGRYNVDVIFTPEDTWFTIDAIYVNDGALSYPYEFDVPYKNGNVFEVATNYLNEHPLEFKLY